MDFCNFKYAACLSALERLKDSPSSLATWAIVAADEFGRCVDSQALWGHHRNRADHRSAWVGAVNGGVVLLMIRQLMGGSNSNIAWCQTRRFCLPWPLSGMSFPS